MAYALILLLGLLGGGICVFVLLENKRRSLAARSEEIDAKEERVRNNIDVVDARQRDLTKQTDLLKTERSKFEAQVISYKELQDENTILKQDLQNVEISLRKLELDRELQNESQEGLDRRSNELAGRYLKETIKWVGASLGANNYVLSKKRLLDALNWCRGIGYEITTEQEEAYLADLKENFEKIVRAAYEREEQARIKAQIREEQKLEKEIERELNQLERERAAIQAALDKALAEAKDEHSAEIEALRARLAEAEEKSQRAISRAQMTKAGHVYVISNIGSFGEGVFKVGMTRRLEPSDRVRELGGASVPFPFDVHMMISCDDAPTLENTIHKELHKVRMNKLKPRKEFFRTDIERIRKIVEENHGQVEYVADPEALEYHQSLDMSDEDEEFIESIYDSLDDEGEALGED